MRHYAAFLLAVLGAGCWNQASGQWYEIIYSDNGMPWLGAYGLSEYCPTTSGANETDSFAYALDFKYDDLDDVDFIGGDSVKLFCRDDTGTTTGYISSLQGSNGEWQGIRSCPEDEYFNGFRLRVYPDQGTFGDDFAVDNIQLACSDGTVVDGLDGVFPPTPFTGIKMDAEDEDDVEVVRKWVEIMGRWTEVVMQRQSKEKARLNGNWGSWAYCSPGMFVVGIRTHVEEGHIGDDAGLTDVTLFCY